MWEPYRGWGAGLRGAACHDALRVTAAARPPNSKHTRPAATATIGPLRAGAPLEGHQQYGSTQSPKSQVRRKGSRPYLLAETRERDSELPCAGIFLAPAPEALADTKDASLGLARSGTSLWRRPSVAFWWPLTDLLSIRAHSEGPRGGDQIVWGPLGSPRKRRVIALAGPSGAVC